MSATHDFVQSPGAAFSITINSEEWIYMRKILQAIGTRDVELQVLCDRIIERLRLKEIE